MDSSEALFRARAAYAAYGEVTDHKNYQGLPMPQFHELSETIQRAWIAAATRAIEDSAILSQRTWRNQFDERQLKEIAFAWHYAANFAHGTTGHNQLMIIAKLTDLLDGKL